MSRFDLSIDYGTTCSVGVISAEGPPELLELDRSRYLSSLVLLDDSGTLLTGRSAINQAAYSPERVCENPKREVGKPGIVLGGRIVPVQEAIAVVLARFANEASRRFDGAAPQRVVLTHPALWADERLEVLRSAARIAGIDEPELVPEPVAAAANYANASLAAGAHVAVYDLGGGTFDVAVLRRTATGFELAGPPGGDPQLGGEDFDEALRDLIEAHAAEIDPDGFQAARDGARASRDWMNFRREVREAKEELSRDSTYILNAPGVSDPVRVTRRELEELLEPHIRHTIDLLAATITDAGLTPADLAALYLTGGSSRIPLVSALITQQLGIEPQTRDDPKAVVAFGAMQFALAPGEGVAQPSRSSAPSSASAGTPPASTQPASTETDAPPSERAGAEAILVERGYLSNLGVVVASGNRVLTHADGLLTCMHMHLEIGNTDAAWQRRTPFNRSTLYRGSGGTVVRELAGNGYIVISDDGEVIEQGKGFSGGAFIRGELWCAQDGGLLSGCARVRGGHRPPISLPFKDLGLTHFGFGRLWFTQSAFQKGGACLVDTEANEVGPKVSIPQGGDLLVGPEEAFYLYEPVAGVPRLYELDGRTGKSTYHELPTPHGPIELAIHENGRIFACIGRTIYELTPSGWQRIYEEDGVTLVYREEGPLLIRPDGDVLEISSQVAPLP